MSKTNNRLNLLGICLLFFPLVYGFKCQAQNPFIRNIYTADPSAHVWQDGRLYVYPSHDIAPPRGCDLMDQYHVFSTDDMVHWTDHGEILRASQVSWGRPQGGFMWAPDCAFKNDTFYFYFPHPSDSIWNTSWKIGIATSTSPDSGFTARGYIPGLESMIDPCVFVDDDQQAYFYYGGGGVCKGGKLKDNMMEIDGEMQDMVGLSDFHEATWVHKRNGKYYLSYADNHDVGGSHNRMRYAMSDNPLGPWTYKGIYIDPTDSYTNHGSIIEYKGQWYAFYHNSALSNNDWLRSVCVDSLFFNDDGTIRKVIQTRGHGTPFGGTPHEIPGIIEAEDFDSGGQAFAYSDNDTTNNGNRYRTTEGVDIEACNAGGYNVGWTNAGEWLEYTVHVSQTGLFDIQALVSSPNGSSIHMNFDGNELTGTMTIPSTGGWQSWDTLSKDSINLKEGIHILQFYMENGGFNFDKIIIKKVVTPPTHVQNYQDGGRKDFQLFPIPASSMLNIEYQAITYLPVEMDIFDLQGRLVKSQNETFSTGNNQIKLDIRSFIAGIYFIRFTTEEKTETNKLIIR